MKLRFSGKKHETGEVWSYYFEPIDTVIWRAGQSIRLELPRKTFGVSERRFTIASSPKENHLHFTTRITDSRFKQLLHALTEGDTIQAYGVDGDFIWQDSPKQKIFIAGGIGITPFRAILADGPHDEPITLLYGSNDAPAVFTDELEGWEAARPGLTIIPVFGRRLTLMDIQAIADWQQSLLYLSGPDAMVTAMQDELLRAGVSALHIKTDQFTGYVE
jgi:ferredoxin-NADP reductase